MINEYKHNKQPKDPKLCKMIRKTITVNRKHLGLEFEEVAHELGLSEGTLANKLKPSMDMSDLTLTEFVHFLELTGDYTALEHIANDLDLVLIAKKQNKSSSKDINNLVDAANIHNAEVFREIKFDMEDGIIDQDEQLRILAKIDTAQKANAALRDRVVNLEICEER